MISILIITKNEEVDIKACLASVSWSNDIYVLDSLSTDKTKEICLEKNVNFVERKFDNYASQRNFGLSLPFKNDWIFLIDADERCTENLRKELEKKIPTLPVNTKAFRIRRNDYLAGKWLKYSQMTPYYIRVVKKGFARYHREINEVIEIDGEIIQSESHFNHFPFSKGYKHWLDKHNQYSTMEAQRWIAEQDGNFDFSLKKALFSKDFSEKRYHQKGLFYKVPFRPFIKWVYLLIFRKGILDGKAGIINANLQAIYEYFIIIKTKELIHKNN